MVKRLPAVVSRIIILLLASVVVAEYGGREAQAAGEDRIASLEKRIMLLEARLARAEGHGGGAGAAKSKKGSAISFRPLEPGAAPQQLDGPAPQPEKTQRDVTPSEFNVFRDNVPTLNQHSFEASIGASYQKRNSALQGDRAALGFVNFRYGLLQGIEASLNIPVYWSQRVTQIGPGVNIAKHLNEIGDISAQVNALVFSETADWPGVAVNAGLTAPTGRSPISFGTAFKVGGNPVDPFFGYQTRGAWVGMAGVQIYKTLDPIIVFAGAGIEYALPQSIEGVRIRYRPRVNYNMGFAFAVNEKTTVGFQVNGSVERPFSTNGAKVIGSGTGSEPIVARVVVVQRVASDTYLEPSVGFGLTSDSPDVTLGVALRRRF